MKASSRRLASFILLSLVSVVLIAWTFSGMMQLSFLSVSVAKISLGIILFWILDNTVLNEINTINELKKGNTSYGLFLCGLFIFIGLCIAWS